MALRNSGFRGPLVRVIINLAPADLRKEGPAFDLPIALALLVASGQLDRPRLEGLWFAGELGLDGSLRPCRGMLAVAELAARCGASALVVPPDNADEAALIDGLVVRTATDLRQLVEQLTGQRPCLRVCRTRPPAPEPTAEPTVEPGQAGRALALAAAGGQLLLVGPGCGKPPAHQSPFAAASERQGGPHHRQDSIGGRRTPPSAETDPPAPIQSTAPAVQPQHCWAADTTPARGN